MAILKPKLISRLCPCPALPCGGGSLRTRAHRRRPWRHRRLPVHLSFPAASDSSSVTYPVLRRSRGSPGALRGRFAVASSSRSAAGSSAATKASASLVRLGFVRIHTLRTSLMVKRLGLATAVGLGLSQVPGWAIIALVPVFLAYSLMVEEARRRMLLTVFDRAPSGTVVSLTNAPGGYGMQVTVGHRSGTLLEKAECGPAPESG